MVVTGNACHVADVQLKRHSLDLNGGEIPVSNQVAQVNLMGHVFKVLAKVLFVSPIRCGCYSQHFGRAEMRQHLLP